MISGFGGSSRMFDHLEQRHMGGGFPVPFNLPNVLHNLLYKEDLLELDAKQKDLHTALRFSYESLDIMLKKYAQMEIEYKTKLLQESQNKDLIAQLENIELDKMDAIQHFKEILEAMAELLTKEQYGKLLKASNLPV